MSNRKSGSVVSPEDIFKQALKNAREDNDPATVELTRESVALLALGESVEVEDEDKQLLVEMVDE